MAHLLSSSHTTVEPRNIVGPTMLNYYISPIGARGTTRYSEGCLRGLISQYFSSQSLVSMPPRKVKLEFIPNERARKVVFNKRKKGIMKKLDQLHTLCDVPACAIIYEPLKPQPHVWPPLPDVENVINMYKSLPRMQQCQKKVTHEDYLKKKIAGVGERLKNLRKENRKVEMTKLMSECLKGKEVLNNQSIYNLRELSKLVDEKMKIVDEHIETLKRTPPPPQIGTSWSAAGEGNDLEATINILREQPCFMEGMDPNEHMGCFGQETMMPSLDDDSSFNPFLL